jgi:excinuclease UvrABC nuclease subunit
VSKWVKFISLCDNRFYQSDPGNDFESTRIPLPDKPAVYVIYDGTQPVYVGSTVSLQNRFGMHKQIMKDMNFSHLKYSLSRHYGDWSMRELRLIKKLRPPMNKNGVKKG